MQRQSPLPLLNLGQNCSFNALLQILFCLIPFNEALKQITAEKLTPFLQTYVNFLSIKNNPPDPAKKINFNLDTNPWVPDASQKLSRIILQPLSLWMKIHQGHAEPGAFDDPNDILEAIKKQCSPEIQKIFSTKLAVERKCPDYQPIEPDNQHLQESDKPCDVDFFTIPVTKENQSLETSLAAYQPEGLSVKKCTKIGCDKKTIVSTQVLEAPAILIIKTVRTTAEGNWPHYVYQINNFKLEYPIQGLRFGNGSYDLAGIISYWPHIKKQNDHIFTFEPTLESHYYAMVRQNGIDYHCNDQYIAPITNEKEFNKAFGSEKKHESFGWAQEARQRYTYLLFYIKRSTTAATPQTQQLAAEIKVPEQPAPPAPAPMPKSQPSELQIWQQKLIALSAKFPTAKDLSEETKKAIYNVFYPIDKDFADSTIFDIVYSPGSLEAIAKLQYKGKPLAPSVLQQVYETVMQAKPAQPQQPKTQEQWEQEIGNRIELYRTRSDYKNQQMYDLITKNISKSISPERQKYFYDLLINAGKPEGAK